MYRLIIIDSRVIVRVANPRPGRGGGGDRGDRSSGGGDRRGRSRLDLSSQIIVNLNFQKPFSSSSSSQ